MSKFTFCVYFIVAIEFLALASSHEALGCTNPKIICYEHINYGATTVQSGIKSDLCDYIVLANAEMTSWGLMSQFNNGWKRFKLLYGDRVNEYHAIGTKVLIALGSWADSNSDKYQRMMVDPQKRNKFISQSIDYVHDHNLDGMQIEFTNPVCHQLKCAGYSFVNERAEYTRLLKEMSAAFHAAGLTLSILVDGRQPEMIQKCFSVAEISSHVDFITVFTEQRVEADSAHTVHLSPLHSQRGSPSVENTFSHLITSGVPASKLALKIATHGIQFKLANPAENGVGAPTIGHATWASDSQQNCKLTPDNGWTVVNEHSNGSYAYKGNTWVAFNSASLAIKKAIYAERLELFGVVMSDPFVSDDPDNICGFGKYPILNEMHSTLRICLPDKPIHQCYINPNEISLPQSNPK